MMPDEVTLGEIGRRVDKLEEAMLRAVSEVKNDLSNDIRSIQFVHVERYEAELNGMRDRIVAIENDNRWTRRTIAGALVAIVTQAVLMLVAARGGI